MSKLIRSSFFNTWTRKKQIGRSSSKTSYGSRKRCFPSRRPEVRKETIRFTNRLQVPCSRTSIEIAARISQMYRSIRMRSNRVCSHYAVRIRTDASSFTGQLPLARRILLIQRSLASIILGRSLLDLRANRKSHQDFRLSTIALKTNRYR